MNPQIGERLYSGESLEVFARNNWLLNRVRLSHGYLFLNIHKNILSRIARYSVKYASIPLYLAILLDILLDTVYWRDGRAVRQGFAKPRTAVQIRLPSLILCIKIIV